MIRMTRWSVSIQSSLTPPYGTLLYWASPDVELIAVCTTRPESAEEARQAFGAKLAFHDF